MNLLVHKMLLSKISKGLRQYLHMSRKAEKSQMDTQLFFQQVKSQVLASQIRCLGSLLNCSLGVQVILAHNKDIVCDIISLVNESKVDVILLTAVTQFCYDVFENEMLIKDKRFMQPFYDKIDHMKELLPYIGMDKYPELIKRTRSKLDD